MAALSLLGHSLHQFSHRHTHHPHLKKQPNNFHFPLSCRSSGGGAAEEMSLDYSDEETKKESKNKEKEEAAEEKDRRRRWGPAVVSALYREAEKWARENLSPKHKGDWKDVLLMSISFSVYVYISQKLVCAYCAWTSMIHHF